MLKILASADYHLGMKFAGYPDVQGELAEARFLCLRSLVDTANELGCDLFLIAGDLFDRLSVSAGDIRRAADLLNDFHGRLAAVLPGNHDFYSGRSSSLWSRFSESAGDRILLLQNPRVYDLEHYDLDILLYAGPCDSKHGKSSAVSWLGRSAGEGKTAAAREGALRIGVAHGSIEGVSPDAQGVYFPMKRSQLDRAPLDLWIIGHTHRQHPSEQEGGNSAAGAPTLLIPGTPEPDGFDCPHGGKAWMIEADKQKQFRLQSLSTGTYRFIREEHTLESAEDLRRLASRLREGEPQRKLLRLRLSGRLSSGELIECRRLAEQLQESLFFAQIDDTGLLERIGEQTVETEFTEGSFPYRLLKKLIAEQDFEALQTAYALLQEQKH
ncbi:MAG: metallophosphoesterase [Spirochaetales bacterium]|nr:metallophosphoesterase [Spirochaetales bacterium]